MNIEEFQSAVDNRKSVVGFHCSSDKPMPAAFINSMQFGFVVKILPRLKVYEPKRKPIYKIHAYTLTSVHPRERWNGVVCGSRGGRDGLVVTGHISGMTCNACLKIISQNPKLKAAYSK